MFGLTKKKSSGKKFGGYMIRPDEKLGAIIGNSPVAPSQMTKKLWAYIKKHGLGKK